MSQSQLCQRQQDVKSGSECNMGVTSWIHCSALLTVIYHNIHCYTNETVHYNIQCCIRHNITIYKYLSLNHLTT